ncbi:MAG: class I SAM-dependent methyltransferase [Candidatus Pacebacteria bacterium]|nr:class I SAM-dependent methyltransferase [Candidatus Paceibacterota bacterium]
MPTIKKCRFCSSKNLELFLDLGFTALADAFIAAEDLKECEPRFPLKVMFCKNCGLSQLSYTVDPKLLYQKDYPYESSITKTGVSHYHNFAESVSRDFNLDRKDLVVDVGSNIGTLLEGFKKTGTKILGVDPAKNIARAANKRGIKTIGDFFTLELAQKVKNRFGQAKIITATNVFAHVYDHDQFMKAVKVLLAKDGCFIFESPHLLNLIKNLEYDTIYHEHLLYLSLRPVIKYLEKFGMEVFKVEEYSIHGGSIRVFIANKNAYKKDPSLAKILEKEDRGEIYSLPALNIFAQRVKNHRKELKFLIGKLKKQGKTVAVVSTPAKGMTLLNYCGITKEDVDFATEKSTLKIGRVTPGTYIPIFPDSELAKRRPDYALLLAWNFSKEIMSGLKEYKDNGGKFIIPIPKPKII